MPDEHRKLAALLQTPVFPQTLNKKRPDPKSASSKPTIRDNVISNSRDPQAERRPREKRVSQNLPTLPHK